MASKFVAGSKERISGFAQEPPKMLMPIEGFENQPLVSLEEAVKPLVSILPKIQTYVHVSKSRCNEPSNHGLTRDESASIMIYTMDWEPHDQCLYVVLNELLRSETRQKLRPWFLYLKLITTALSKLPSTRNILFRGVTGDLSGRYTKGSTFVWWAFSSCTKSVAVIEQFLGKTGERTIFSIECESGKDIKDYGYFSMEDEVLLLPARQFQVTSCLNTGNGLHIIQVKEIEPPYPLLSVDFKVNPKYPIQATPERATNTSTVSKPPNEE